MASFKADAELMTNLVAASPVPAGSHFKTLRDNNGRPMVISLSNDASPKLQVVQHDLKGIQYLFDLGSCFDLPTDALLQAFDAVQDSNNLIYLVFAYTRDGKHSNAVVAMPFPPASLQAGVKLTKIPGPWSLGPVKRIFMSPIYPTVSYPLIFVTHQNLDQLVSWGDDITRLVPDPNLRSWRKDSSLSTPVNVAGILDVCTATNIHGQGIFVLYKTSTGTAKIYGEFIKPDPQSDTGSLMKWASEVQCPKDTKCIEAFLDDNNDSALVLGAPSGLYYLDADATIEKTKPVLLSDNSKMQGCKSLVTAQDKKNLSVWFTSTSDQLGYIRCTTADFSKSPHLPESILLLPEGTGLSFSPLLSSPTKAGGNVFWQTLVSNDRNGNLSLLEQGSDLGLWRRKPFYTTDTASNIPVKSYSITIKALDANGSPVKRASVRIRSASAITGLLNGLAVTLSSSSDWYGADAQGMLNFIVPTESLASQVLNLDGLRDSKGKDIPVGRMIVDPTRRCMEKLGTKLKDITNVDRLKKATTQSGKPLFDPKSMPNEADLETGLKSLRDLHGAYEKFPADGSPVAKPNPPAASMDTANTHTVMLASEPTGILPASGSVGDWLMDKWNWIVEKAHEVGEWFVDTAGRVWRFVCKIAGEAFEFILDSMEKIGEALTWVWNKIKVGIEKLIEYIGFIFNWGDILKTKNTVSSLITAGSDLAARKVGSAAMVVDTFFDGILAKIEGIEVAKNVTVSPKSGKGNDENSKKVNDAQHSTSFNWTGERMKNGGMSSSTEVSKPANSQSDAQKTWDEIFTPALSKIYETFLKVGEDINTLWYKKGGITTQDFLKLCKDILKSGVVTIQKLVVALIEAFQKVIQFVSEYGNKEIHIPIFSKLYEAISGHKLTAFDAMSLLISIPATIFTKLITGKAPPQIPGLNADLLDGLVFGNKSVTITPQMKVDFNTLTTGLTVSATLVTGIVNFIKLTIALANEGTGGAIKVLSSGAFIEFFSVILDMFSALNSLPSDTDIPGFEYRKWISYFSLIRGGSHIIATFVPSKAVASQTKDKLLLVLDLAVTLINFALYQPVADAELKAKGSWKDYDENSTVVGIESSVLNAVSGVGYFIAFMFKENVEISGIALIVLEACTGGLAASQGIKWKINYDKGHRCLLTPNAT